MKDQSLKLSSAARIAIANGLEALAIERLQDLNSAREAGFNDGIGFWLKSLREVTTAAREADVMHLVSWGNLKGWAAR